MALVLVDKSEGVATLTLNNPAERNSLTLPMVDAIVAGEAVSAMTNLAELETALAESGNEELASNGSAFFATISDTVPDAGGLTVEESASVGDRALAEAQPRLGALLDECAAIGLAITNLPTGDDRP